jgi:hypothetical protein
MKRLVATLCILLGMILPAAAAKRIALVIGNGNYAHVIDLKNPVNDADLMERTLKDVGFEVQRYNDLDQRGMKQAMLEFGRKLKEGAEASMFYYAGHGIEIAGENYLVPVDADLQSSEEADIQNVSVNSFLSLSENSGVAMNIVILDACRNNPFRSLRGAGDGGLAPVKAPSGTYVAYATAPGAVANDGDSANSPFTLALTESMRQPGLTLEAVLKLTRAKVQTQTNGKQLPFDSSAITGDFYFVPVVATAPPQQTPQRDTAQDAYQAAGDDPDLLRVVVDKFGDTVWAALATEKLKHLAPPPKPKTIVAEPPPASLKPKTQTKPVMKKAAKVYVAPPVKPKRRIVIIEKPRVVIQPKKAVTVGLRCDSTAALRQGTICKSNDGRICRVAAVRFGKGGGRPILMGCR